MHALSLHYTFMYKARQAEARGSRLKLRSPSSGKLRDVLVPLTDAGAIRDTVDGIHYAGSILVPFANRVANGTYELLIDMNEEQSGVVLDDWPFLPPKQIKDKRHRKPKDWVDEATILTGRHKPLWWDDVPKRIPDPEAVEPDDWDDAVDGEWAAPTIDNPEYKGAWKPKRVKNPAFKGKWGQPMKDNPDYFTDDDAGIYDDFGVVGIELWQVTAGTIFDNIFIGDDVDEARAHAEDTWHRWWPAERALKDRELRERYMKIYEDEDDDDDDDDDEDDDEGEGEEDDAPPAPKQEL